MALLLDRALGGLLLVVTVVGFVPMGPRLEFLTLLVFPVALPTAIGFLLAAWDKVSKFRPTAADYRGQSQPKTPAVRSPYTSPSNRNLMVVLQRWPFQMESAVWAAA